MSPKLLGFFSFLLLLWLGVLSSVQAEETQIALRDYLGQQWTNELLTYPFSAPPGACSAASVTLTGPRGPVPAQLSDFDYWPGTQSVKSANMSFLTSLAPLASDTYTVRYRC